MARVTVALAILLILLGLVGYFGTGRTSCTALIPAMFGLAFLILGVVAIKDELRRHAIHVAAALAV